MKKYIVISVISLALMGTAAAGSKGFVSIPAAAFTAKDSDTYYSNGNAGGSASKNTHGYIGNKSGTTRSFNSFLYAPVNLPHGATVTSFSCGGSLAKNTRTVFMLRRNEPQQENVNMVQVNTSLEGSGFEFIKSLGIRSAKVDNQKYNYYIVARILKLGYRPSTTPYCTTGTKTPECSVGFCSIGYTEL